MRHKISLLAILTFFALYSANAQYSTTDRDALLQIKVNCDANNMLNWLADTDPSSWDGVTWNSASPRRVYRLNINEKSLSGSLDVSELSYLNTLNCSDNNLTGLNVSGLIQLTTLIFNNNSVSSIDMTNLFSLNNFQCCNNQLTDIDLSVYSDIDGPITISNFFCSGNNLEELDLSLINGYVYILRCDSNQLRHIDFRNVQSLVTCTKNHLPFSELQKIGVYEYLIEPQHEIFTPKYYTENTTIDYSAERMTEANTTQFTFFKDDVQVAQNTTGLFITTGNGTYHCTMTNSKFYNVTLKTAPVVISDDITFDPMEMTALRVIDTNCDEGNNLNWDTSEDPSEWNGISWTTTDSNPRKVRNLNLNNKALTGDMDISPLNNLEDMDCSFNEIKNLTLTGLSKLKKLNCSNNKLEDLNVADLTSLTDLNCKNNPLPLTTLAEIQDVPNVEFDEEITVYEPVFENKLVTLDYSDQATIENTATSFTFYKNGVEEETNTTGKFTITEEGEYFCVMKNLKLNSVTITTATVTVNLATGVEITRGNELKLFPNPVEKTLYFSGDKKIQKAEIFSLSGRKIASFKNPTNGIDVSGLTKGVYLIRLVDGKNSYAQLISRK